MHSRKEKKAFRDFGENDQDIAFQLHRKTTYTYILLVLSYVLSHSVQMFFEIKIHLGHN